MSRRIVDVGTRSYTQVECLDSMGAGCACHQYLVSKVLPAGEAVGDDVFAMVKFQNLERFDLEPWVAIH